MNPCILVGKLDNYLVPESNSENALEFLYVYNTDSDLKKGLSITDLGVRDKATSLEIPEIVGEVEKSRLIDGLIQDIFRARIVVTDDENVTELAMSLGKFVLKGPNLFDSYTLAPQKILDLLDNNKNDHVSNRIYLEQMQLSKVLKDFFSFDSGAKNIIGHFELQRMILIETVKYFKDESRELSHELGINRELLLETELRLQNMRSTFTWRITKAFRLLSRVFRRFISLF